MDPTAIQRLKDQIKQSHADEFEEGKKCGLEWGQKHAEAKWLEALEKVSKKTLKGPFNLGTHITRASGLDSTKENIGRVFGEYLPITAFRTPTYLEGFVAGALLVWAEVKQALTVEITASTNQSTGSEMPWKGWFRSAKGQPWLIIIEGLSEIDVAEKMACAVAGGDKMVLARGEHPDNVLHTRGTNRVHHAEAHG